MASSKEIQHSSRPLSQHRLSVSTNSGSLPRSSHSRNHSHSVAGGSLIPSSRVTRRKSVSSNFNNVAAMVAAVKEAGDSSSAIPISVRRGTMTKSISRSGPMGSLPSPPASLPGHRMRMSSTAKSERSESAIDDDNNDDEMEDDDVDEFAKDRMRRASESGQPTKDGKKANANDLKCDKCGKGYKHSSCLSKHLWEHTPEWSYTSKLLISKHQQVQLLEAASVLVTMNQNANTPPDSAKDFHSDDQDSASPTASGSEDHDIDGASSADTTPPPADIFHGYGSSSYNPSKRYSNGQGYARSYQSASSNNYLYGGSIPSGFGHQRQQSHERRPPSSGMNGDQEDEGLSTAIELLSCSFGSAGTPRSGLLILEDAPPVPDIPAQYLNDLSGTHFTPSLHPRQTESYTRHQIHSDGDVKMEESEESIADDEDYDRRSRARSDEDDDGVFGRMEE